MKKIIVVLLALSFVLLGAFPAFCEESSNGFFESVESVESVSADSSADSSVESSVESSEESVSSEESDSSEESISSEESVSESESVSDADSVAESEASSEVSSKEDSTSEGIKVEFNTNNLGTAAKHMGVGMLGVFIVLSIIALVVVILNKVFKPKA